MAETIEPMSDPYWVYDPKKDREVAKGTYAECEKAAKHHAHYVILPNN